MVKDFVEPVVTSNRVASSLSGVALVAKSRRPWSLGELAALRRLYPDTPTAKIAARLRRTLTTVYQAAYRLGLKKSAAYLSSPASGRTNGRQGMGTRFLRGMTPWNKGAHYMPGGNIRAGWFKPGHRNAGHPTKAERPLGAERINVDGYRERKVTHSGRGSERWRAVHVLMWESANGTVPRGHAVIFKNGDKTDIRLENLECLSRADLMRRNTYHRYPKEIALAIQLRGALQRQINKRAA